MTLLHAAIALAVAMGASGPALAGSPDRFIPSASLEDGQRSLQLLHPVLGERGRVCFGLFIVDSEHFGDLSQPRRMSAARLGMGYTASKWLRVEMDLPYYQVMPDDRRVMGAPGDLRAGTTSPLWGNETLGLALGTWVGFPTGSVETSLGGSGGATAAIGGSTGRLGWRINGGIRIESLGEGFDLGAGLDISTWKNLALGAEITSTVLPGSGLDPPLFTEGHTYAIYGDSDSPRATLALGTALTSPLEAPAWRVLLGLTWAGLRIPVHGDMDSVPPDEDICPHSPEDLDGWLDSDGCPDPDNDNDNIPDAVDACPHQPEDPDSYRDEDGCPDPDNDGDGVPDGQDLCPRTVGTWDTYGCPDADADMVADARDECPQVPGRVAASGCPDSDKDGIPDYRDRCPELAVAPALLPESSEGCPVRAHLRQARIDITETVEFETGKAQLKTSSRPVLMDVARVIRDNPAIRLLEVAGHTDSLGSAAMNQQLSRKRAEAVRRFLIQDGAVEPERLVVRGYGESLPLDSNSTPQGRARNRRVEFLVLLVGSTDTE